MVYIWTRGIDKDSWYRQGHMVKTTPKILTHGIESVLLNHAHMRGPNVTRMPDFYVVDSPPFTWAVVINHMFIR